MRLIYWVGRAFVALAGIFIIFTVVVSELLVPSLYYDYEEEVPPFVNRMAVLGTSLGVGLLFLIPNRWTFHPVLFWSRFAIYVLLAGYFVFLSFQGLSDGLSGRLHVAVVPVSVVIGVLGVFLPISLLMRRYHLTQ